MNNDKKILTKTTIALSAALVLSTPLPASAANKHRRVSHVHSAIYNMVPDDVAAAVPLLVVHLAVAVARGLVLVHHQIAVDEVHSSGTFGRVQGGSTAANASNLDFGSKQIPARP